MTEKKVKTLSDATKSEAEAVKSFRREVTGLGKKLVQKIQIQVDRGFTTLVKNKSCRSVHFYQYETRFHPAAMSFF